MFLKNLYDFQAQHEENLLSKCAEHRELILSAPTGAGKTVIISKFIDDYLDENPNTVFLWLCPGDGGLEKQSQKSFRDSISGIQDGDVYDFINETTPNGKVYFINWQKINKTSNVVLREGEKKNLMERVLYCHQNNIEIFMVIDEEHKNKNCANEYITIIQPRHILRVSATPDSKGDYIEKITDDEAISAGLISSGISINNGVSKALEDNNNFDDDILLLELADKKRKEILTEYNKLGLQIRPLILIQFPNARPDWIERIKNKLGEMGYPESSGLISCWFDGEHPDSTVELKRLNGKCNFLLFKQAIATGWDCPRAKILVKLREGSSEKFDIQTIGRIRRMPERIHYDNDLLDNCYLYTLDSKFSEGLVNSVDSTFYTYQYKKKSNVSNIKLKKEYLKGSDIEAIDQEAVVKVIRERMLEECDLNKNGRLEKLELEKTKGYTFSTKLKTSAYEGVARTRNDLLKLKTNLFAEHELNNHNDGFIIRDAKRRIARAIGINEYISNNALRVLFGPEEKEMSIMSEEEKQFENENKLIESFSLKEYNAFLVNNKDLLVETFEKISAEEIADIKEAPISESYWEIPSYQYYKQHKKQKSTKIYIKNVFENYGNNILIQPNRSCTEIELEKWLENNNSIKWYYKNGDKGVEYFSIVYRTAFGRKNFYPDYIVQTCDDVIWILEAKGGMTPDSESNNIDKFAKNKFEALKQYCNQNLGIKWGFVRLWGDTLYMSNTNWVENMSDTSTWVPINNFFMS